MAAIRTRFIDIGDDPGRWGPATSATQTIRNSLNALERAGHLISEPPGDGCREWRWFDPTLALGGVAAHA